MERVSVCFVCLGNICRSPTAEAVMTHLVESKGLRGSFSIDSAGTAAYHTGEAPDRRSVAAAARRGISVKGSARQFVAADFTRFDYVVAMDSDNLRHLRRLAPNEAASSKLSLLRTWDKGAAELDVPDPYYGGVDGFDHVVDICLRGCAGLLQHIHETNGWEAS